MSSSGVSEAPLSSAARRSSSFDAPLIAPIVGGSSASARPTRDRSESASDSPNPAAAVSPLIPLLLLESAQTKKSAAALKRDAEQMPRRAEALVAHLVPSGPPKVVVVRSCAYAPGMIIGMRRTVLVSLTISADEFHIITTRC